MTMTKVGPLCYKLVLASGVFDAESDIEVERTITPKERTILALAAKRGSLMLRLTMGAKTGSPTFDLTSLEEGFTSGGSTTWCTWQTLSGTVNAVGITLKDVSSGLADCDTIRLQIGSATLNESNKFGACEVALIATVETDEHTRMGEAIVSYSVG